ncbi:unnamed protein product [Rotaria socialis]|nr:unnamed protein product [Rotaria socialis]
MDNSSIELSDLPNEILMIILKKLFNVEVLYSLIGVNKRLHAIVYDPIFTNCLTLMRCVSDDSIDPLPDSILDRLCSQILPEIHHKIKCLNLESSSMKRILLATSYPNLCELGLYDIEIETVMSLFIDESSLTSIDKNQILAPVINRTKYGKVSAADDMNPRTLAPIFTTFSNLQYLNFYPSTIWSERLSFANPCPSINSSTLLELHIRLMSFSGCLYILDGCFNNLHTLHVDIQFVYASDLRNNNQEKLPIPNIRCFSLYCSEMTNAYDELTVPHLQRMSNLEKLKDIQHSFKDFKDDQIISYIDYFQEGQHSLCHIYLYSYKLKYYHTITNNFPGGLFKYVHELLLYDERPFEREFFLRIAQSFPFINILTIKNSKAQNNKLCRESKNGNQDLSIIKYPHLTSLSLNEAHDDYIEEFLVDTRTCLPNNSVHLNIFFRQLKRMTHNFTRDVTRINCAKLVSICANACRLPQYTRAYFPHVRRF